MLKNQRAIRYGKKSRIDKFTVLGILFFLLICIFSPGKAESEKITRADVELFTHMQSHGNIPDYCKCKLTWLEFKDEYRSVSPGEYVWPETFGRYLKQTERKVGSFWPFMHHYCRGIKWLYEYRLMSPKEKETLRGQYTIKSALEEFNFTLKRAPTLKDFPFWYPLYNYLSQTYMYLGKPNKAQWAMMKAIEYKKKHKTRSK